MLFGRPIHPILTCAEAQVWEKHLLGDDADQAWAAMERAGAGVGAAIIRDFTQWRLVPRDPRVLVLAGPGHNGGDALLAAREILRARPRGHVSVILLEPIEKLKPLTKRAWDNLSTHPDLAVLTPEQFLPQLASGKSWDITLDGLYGMSFRPPLREPARGLITAVNSSPQSLGFRVAVDVPSGIADQSDTLAFQADFTYATGITKKPLFDAANAQWVGRIRTIDIGFFEKPYQGPQAFQEYILLPTILHSLGHLRDPASDKRTYGHLLVVSGSRSYPGAQMLNVLGALRAGAGLVTALTPSAHAAAFAAERPEAMWRACPEEADGGHGDATLVAAKELWPRATAVLAGSGLGRGAATQAMLQSLVRECPLPMVLDADALMPATLESIAQRPTDFGKIILTPHAGEFARIAGEGADLREFCAKHKVVTILKGPITRICDGISIYCSTFGGPVLARGGSGDILAGIVGALLSQDTDSATHAARCGVVWHGLAADALARDHGETAALTAELAAHLPAALRNDWGS